MCVKVDKSSGMLVLPANLDTDGYNNLFGSYKKYDKEQSAQIYQEAVEAYPDTTDCATLSQYLTSIQNDIDVRTQNMASNCDSGCQRVQGRHKTQLIKRQGELKNMYAASNCAAAAQAQSDSDYFNQLNQTLGSASPTTVGTTGNVLDSIKSGFESLFGGSDVSTTDTTGATANKPNYLLYAGIGVGALVVIFALKKLL